MLRGEGNAGKRLGVISKKATLHVRHTFFCAFLCRCFARLQCESSSRNFLVTRFLEECCTCSRSLFFRVSSFSPGISHFVTTATKFSCCSSNKEMSPLFFFFLVELRWPAAYFLFSSVFVLLYIPNLWI